MLVALVLRVSLCRCALIKGRSMILYEGGNGWVYVRVRRTNCHHHKGSAPAGHRVHVGLSFSTLSAPSSH